MNLEKIWDQVEFELPRIYQGKSSKEMLLPPATEAEIAALEREFGVELPLDYKQSLQIHSGALYWVWLWGAVSLLPPNKVVRAWRENLELAAQPHNKGATLKPVGPVIGVLFDPRWIPFAEDNGIPICLDLAPAQGGLLGQVICVDWEDGTVRVVASSYSTFLERGVSEMKRVPSQRVRG